MGVDVSAGLNASLENTMTGEKSNGSSLNSLYREQVGNGTFQGSFAEFLNHLSVNKVIDTGYNVADSVRKFFAKSAGISVEETPSNEPPASSMKSMYKWMIGVGVVSLAIWGGVVLYKKYGKN